MSKLGSVIIGGRVDPKQPGDFVPLSVNKREFEHLKTSKDTILSMTHTPKNSNTYNNTQAQ